MPVKRSFIGSSDGTLAAGQSKRTKSSQACASCRRHKTRCELLGNISPQANIKCHRCQVLGIECSFETSDALHIIPQTPQASSTSIVAEDRFSASVIGPSSSPSNFRRSEGIKALNAGIMASQSTSRVTIENLVPSPDSISHIMGTPSKYDWGATPILAIQELLKGAPGLSETPFHIDQLERLDTILPLDQISSLLEIFKSRYEPWTNGPIRLIEYSTPTPMLDLIRCQVASRDLDSTKLAIIAPRLQKLTEKAASEVSNLPSSTEQVEALLIMALWAPVCGYATKETDPREIVSKAVNIGVTLHLDQASKSIRREEVPHPGISDQRPEEGRLKARLWLSLSTLESLLCIGTGKTCASQRCDADYIPVNVPAYNDLSNARGNRLGLLAQVINTTEKGCSLRLAGRDDIHIEKFRAGTVAILEQINVLKRWIVPTPVISPFEAFQFHILLVQCHACRLLILHHALQELRRVFHETEAENRSTNLAITLTEDAMACAQAVLTDMLVWQKHEQLATAPDYIFWMISFAAVWLVTFNFRAYQTNSEHIDGACDRLLTMTIMRLSGISRSPDHTSVKCSHLISHLYRTSQSLLRDDHRVASSAGENRDMPGDTAGPSSAQTNSYLGPPDMISTPLGHAPTGSWDGQAFTSASGNMNDFGETFGADASLGAEFWTSFMNNLPLPPP